MSARWLLAAGMSLAATCFMFVVAGPAPGRSAGESDTAELLARYQPVAMLYRADWTPVSVDSFLRSADLERRVAGSWRVVRSRPAASSLPGGSRSYRLDATPCTPARDLDGCYRRAATGSPAPAPTPTVYGRVWGNPGSGTIRTVLQYWFLYSLNDWRNALVRPGIWQMHEGDWEMVTVALAADDQPLLAAYSQHLLGVLRDWRDVPLAGDTHPVVYVALGSHANYFSVGLGGKAGAPHNITTRFSGVPLSEPDFTSDQVSIGPAGLARRAARLVDLSDGAAAWLAFAGSWGDGGYLLVGQTSGGKAVWTHVAYGDSPSGPAFHRVWRNPLGPFTDWPRDDGH